MTFGSWDRRPVVIVGDDAFALLSPGGDWVKVDRADVGATASLIPSEAEFRARFAPRFGDFGLPAIS